MAMAEDAMDELREAPFTYVKWKIKTFLNLPTEVNYFLNSPSFSLSDARWYIQIFPNGRTSNNGRPGWISLYLRKECSATVYRVALRLGIKKADGTVLVAFDREETYGLEDKGWGRAKVIRRSELPSSNNNEAEGYGWGWPLFSASSPDRETLTPDGVLTVFCTARIVDSPLLTSTTNTASQNPSSITRPQISTSQTAEAASQTLDGIPTLIENFKDLYLNKRQTDITIIVKEREYFSHRSVLATRSTVFDTMFNNNMTEKNTGRIKIDDCDPDAFGVFLLYLYTGDLSIVSPSNAAKLYEIAKKYNLNELQVECIQCMICSLSVDSICVALHVATLHDESELLEAAIDFFNNNTRNILITTNWHTFISENPLLGNELIIKSFNHLESNDEDSI